MTLVLHPERFGAHTRRLLPVALRHVSGAAPVSAALTTGVWYAFGMLPVQVAATVRLGLTPAQAASLLFVVWAGGAVASLVLSLTFRQPIAITSSTPALLYLAAMSGRFPLTQLMGATLVAGLAIVALGLLGVGQRVLNWLPLPLAMGMFAGSVVGDLLRIVPAARSDSVVVGATLAGYLVARVHRSSWAPPVGVAALSGALAILVTHSGTPAPIAWVLPRPVVPAMQFSLPAAIALGLPVTVLAMGLGNVQGAGVLVAQGYRVPMKTVTVAVGLASVVNALLGGHAANLSRIGVAILGGPEAGPKAGRYRASVIASALMLLLGVAAAPIVSLLAVLPRGYIVAVGCLALLAAFQDALVSAFRGALPRGALAAFMVAATPFVWLGLPSACWALAAGLLVSLLTERTRLRAFWRNGQARRVTA